MREEQQSLDTLVVSDRPPAVFRLSSASYNLLERDDPDRFELTFRCATQSASGHQNAPKLEITIVATSKPPIEAGSVWADQPGYIERENVWNVSNYYEWTHETFEDFTVRVLETAADRILCLISGHITLNRQQLPKTSVAVFGWFRFDHSTERSVW